MAGKWSTELIHNKHVIYTRYEGVVAKAEVLAAVQEQLLLLQQHPELRVLIFDYTEASMAQLQADDVIAIARNTGKLIEAQPELLIIGVVPNDEEFGLTRMWRVYSETQGGAPEHQLLATRSLDHAIEMATAAGAIPV